MDPRGGVMIFGAVLALLGLPFLLWARNLHKAHRLWVDTPTSNIRSMALGFVEVKATAQLPPGVRPFVTRFTKQQCLAWEYSLQEQRTRETKHGKRTYWINLEAGGQTAPFALRDATGTCMLDPAGQTFPMPGNFVTSRPEQAPEVAEFLQRGLFSAPRRVTERWLPIGLPLLVQGTAHRPPNAQGVGNQALVITKGAGRPLTITMADEAKLTQALGVGFWILLVLGVLMFGAGMAVIGLATTIKGGPLP